MRKRQSYLSKYSKSYQKVIVRKLAKETGVYQSPEYYQALDAINKGKRRVAQAFYSVQNKAVRKVEAKKVRVQKILKLKRKRKSSLDTVLSKNTSLRERVLANAKKYKEELPKKAYQKDNILSQPESTIKAIFSANEQVAKQDLKNARAFIQTMAKYGSKDYIHKELDSLAENYQALLKYYGDDQTPEVKEVLEQMSKQDWRDFVQSDYFTMVTNYPSPEQHVQQYINEEGRSPFTERLLDFWEFKKIKI